MFFFTVYWHRVHVYGLWISCSCLWRIDWLIDVVFCFRVYLCRGIVKVVFMVFCVNGVFAWCIYVVVVIMVE